MVLAIWLINSSPATCYMVKKYITYTGREIEPTWVAWMRGFADDGNFINKFR